MAKTANLYARIEPELKQKAEEILSDIGIPASSAITMFYKQIIHRSLISNFILYFYCIFYII